MAAAMRLLSLQSGTVRLLRVEGHAEMSAIDKRPLEGTVRIGPEGIEGDEVGDTKHHGGPDQALLCFSADHYPLFESRLGRRLAPGSFGENLTLLDADEGTVRLGDVYRVGTCEFEVTAPRAPCRTLAGHLQDPGIVAAIGAPHRAGWYARVLTPGEAQAGDDVLLVRRGDAAWTVRRAAAVKADRSDTRGAVALLAVPGLAARWRASMRERAEGRA
jgi:MOSC domain-containing protein YiiM